MRMMLLSTALVMLGSAALAASPERVRGTIVSATESSLTVRETTGQVVTIALTPKTRFGESRASSLSAIEPGGFIGTATKDDNGKNIALEVVVFPPSMRGTGEGSYAWDSIPDTTAAGATVTSHMTNGDVQSAMPATASHMTNGNVQASTAANGDKTLVVTYKGGQQTILVPPTAPVVKVAPATYAALRTGESAFIVALPGAAGLTAAYVNVGLGGIKLVM
jgi:hypothetical protein